MFFANRLISRILNKYFRMLGFEKKTNLFDPSDSYLEKEEFKYILWIDRVYSLIRNTPGHIVEIGVSRGRNSILFGHLIKMHGESNIRRYYGFDTFEGYTKSDLQDNSHLSENAFKETSLEFVNSRLQKTNLSDICSVIKGDIRDTGPEFLKNSSSDRFQKGHFQTAMLYMDCNAYEPALEAMELFKPFLAPGGVICIDEKMQGGETKALTEFCMKYGLDYRKDAGPFSIPAYTRLK